MNIILHLDLNKTFDKAILVLKEMVLLVGFTEMFSQDIV